MTRESPLFKYGNYGDAYWRLHYADPGRAYPGAKAHLLTELQEAGYKPSKSLAYRDLAKLWLHHTLAHVCYDSCSDAEIKKFAVDRRLVLSNTKLARGTLAKKLMEDDMDPSFRGFLDLPPEIRTIIYDLYMSDFATESLQYPCQPPLTRASQLLRKETLPLFFSTCTLCIDTKVENDGSLTAQKRCEAYPGKLTKANLGLIRTFNIEVMFSWKQREEILSNYKICIAMSSSQASFQVSLAPHWGGCAVQ